MRRIFVFGAAAHAAKILFIHQSFPGQFATLLRLFVASGRHQLVALHVRPDLAAAAAAALPPATDCSPGGGDAATEAEDDLEINACLAKVYSESFPGGPPPLEGDDDPRLSSNR